MTDHSRAPDVTGLLASWHHGDAAALDRLMPLVYNELRRVARGHLRREPAGHTLQPTALVHEVFLRLVAADRMTPTNRTHFFAISARLMRQVLVDLARARLRLKRNAMQEVPLDGISEPGREIDQSILAMHDALDRLARTDPRKAQLVEMRYFGGMTAEESAAALSISVHVVRHELRIAEAWLHKEIAG